MAEMTIQVTVQGAQDLERAVKCGIAALDAGAKAIVEQRRTEGLRVVRDGSDRRA